MNEPEFVAAVLKNSVNREIVSRLRSLGLSDVWLVSGALFQSAWNAISGRAPDYGIKDYDIFYFDPDLSWEAEDAVIERASEVFADLGQRVEIRNQGRVHLWYQEKFGAPYSPLSSARQGIDRFLMTCAQVGIGHRIQGTAVYAPSGFADIEDMIIRPNRTSIFKRCAITKRRLDGKEIGPNSQYCPREPSAIFSGRSNGRRSLAMGARTQRRLASLSASVRIS